MKNKLIVLKYNNELSSVIEMKSSDIIHIDTYDIEYKSNIENNSIIFTTEDRMTISNIFGKDKNLVFLIEFNDVFLYLMKSDFNLYFKALKDNDENFWIHNSVSSLNIPIANDILSNRTVKLRLF